VGRIQNDAGRAEQLFAETTLGRSRKSDVSIPESWVSSQHTAIRWTVQGWEARDLGSRNGTTLNGRTLAPSTWHALALHDVLTLGHTTERWTLVDDSQPVAFAESPEGRVVAVDGALELPSADAPEVEVYVDDAGTWHALRGDDEWSVSDGDRLTVGETEWTLHVPEVLVATRDQRAKVVTTSKVVFLVSQDFEDIEIEVHTALGVDHFKHQAHNWLLLELARARIADGADDPATVSEHGWCFRPDLADKLKIKKANFNMSVYRARHMFRARDFIDADEACQHRQGAGTVRLGFADIEIRYAKD